MHSYIIRGGTDTQRDASAAILTKEWNIHPFDVLRLEAEENSVSIAQIRTFISSLQLKPSQSSLHAGIIPHGELLSAAASQALLKTLEEPPETVRIIISVPNTSVLLPTIISRCQVISIATAPSYTDTELELAWKEITALQEASRGEKLRICATLGKTKEELSEFLSRSIAAIRSHMLNSKEANLHDATLLHRLLTAKKYEGTNINLSLYIEHIFITANDVNIM